MTDNSTELKADTNPDNKIKIVIGDTQSLFRLGVVSTLSHEADIIIEGEASSKEELIDKVTCTIPDVVLLDINLPTGNCPRHHLDSCNRPSSVCPRRSVSAAQ